MKFSPVSATAALLFAGTAYAGGDSSRMDKYMAMKLKDREYERSLGLFDKAKSDQTTTPCVNGMAGEYSCSNVDMWGFLSHADMGSTSREGNDVWGWTSPDGREFALVGQTDGTAFAEVLSDGSLDYIGRLPTQTEVSNWRDIKVIGNHAYIGSEARGHGMQVFDLKKLLKVKPRSDSNFKPKTFSIQKDLAAFYGQFGNSHNIVANEETNMIYAVGTSRSSFCRGGLWMLDVSNPSKPQFAGCVNQDGYVHDAQCIIYRGEDVSFQGHEICYNYNEDTLTIVDVTDKWNPVQLSRTPYMGNEYTHQGWIADSGFKMLLLNDEGDEVAAVPPASNQRTTTRIVNVTDITNPTFSGIYQSPVKAIDHNLYVIDGVAYQSNYNSGLRIIDVSSAERGDFTGSEFREIGFFDCYPEDDANPMVRFVGSWSVYPYFKSQILILNSIERGVFALKYTGV